VLPRRRLTGNRKGASHGPTNVPSEILISTATMIVQAFKKNVAKEVAHMKTAQDYGARIVARVSYWLGAEQ
jgi:hypothetical protein